MSTVNSVWQSLRRGPLGGLRFEAKDDQIEAVFELMTRSQDPRFRFESLTTLRALLHYGKDEHRERARQVLEKLAADEPGQLGEQARVALDEPFEGEALEMLLEQADE